MGMVSKNIEYMNGGCFENLSGTSVPKNIGRGPPPRDHNNAIVIKKWRIKGFFKGEVA
jgi:hypothetical protein